MQKINLDKRTVVFIVFIVLLIGEMLFLMPWSFKRLKDVDKKIEQLKQNLQIAEEDWPRKDEYLSRKKQLEIETKIIQSKFIGTNQEAKLLAFLSSASKDFGVKIDDFLPTRLQEVASTNFGTFFSLPIKISAKSKFHNLVMFLDYIQNGPYFFEVKNLKIITKYPKHTIGMLICGIIKKD